MDAEAKAKSASDEGEVGNEALRQAFNVAYFTARRLERQVAHLEQQEIGRP